MIDTGDRGKTWFVAHFGTDDMDKVVEDSTDHAPNHPARRKVMSGMRPTFLRLLRRARLLE